MAQIAFWPAPKAEHENAVERIQVLRANSLGGSYNQIADIDALDNYDNWVTHYYDADGDSGDWYKAQYLDGSGNLLQETFPEPGQSPYNVTPQMVLDSIQGLPLNSVASLMVQLRIKWAIEWVELQIRQSLSLKTATKEIYSRKAFGHILGDRIGHQIQLRNFPVQSVDAVYYRLRTDNTPNDVALEGLDIQIENHNPVTGYNHGAITIYPTYTSLEGIFAGYLGSTIDPYDVAVKITYTYGYPSSADWPKGVAEMVTKMAAMDIMEIAGEAETAGLSSRSIDGYSESYTASATTTIFSARRIMYQDQIKELVKLHRKPLWG